MKSLVFRCKSHNPLHLGMGQLDESDVVIHSDTLFSALVHAHLLLYGEDGLESFISAFRSGEIALSSAFPVLENADGERIWFLPAPADLVERMAQQGVSIKPLKRIRFISADVLGLLREGVRLNQVARTLGGTFLLTRDEMKLIAPAGAGQALLDQPAQRPLSLHTAPHVVVHQPGQEDAYYTVTVVHPRSCLQGKQGTVRYATHYHCLWESRTDDSALESRFRACIALLADEGLGGERSAGNGGFSGVEFLDESPFSAADGSSDAYLSLGMGIPADDSEFAALSRYRLVVRGGNAIGRGVEGTFSRGRVRMVAEGAVCCRMLTGTTTDLRGASSPNPVWRYGQFFTIPIPSNG